MSEIRCKNCRHYVRHYGLGKDRLFRLNCGHCSLVRPRQKRPDTKACPNFEPGPPDEAAFATKEYLSKELLKYVLELELLPEIEEA